MNITYRTNLLLRIGFLLFSAIGSCTVFIFSEFWLLGIFLAFLSLIAVILIFQFILLTERELDNFLVSIKQGDFSMGFTSKKYLLGEKISNAYRIVSDEFKRVRSEKESEHALLTAILEHLAVPIICMNKNNSNIIMSNSAAKKMLKKPEITGLKALGSRDEKLLETVKNLKKGGRKLIRVNIDGEFHDLAIFSTELILQEIPYILISFQDIKKELEEQEIKSWQRLIRVLTHEIKNSTIPISTMSEVLCQLIEEEEGIKGLESEKQIKNGLNTIAKRSKNLSAFIGSYNKLANIPEPEYEQVKVTELITNVCQLYQGAITSKGITFTINGDKNHIIKTDPKLLEQVIINLLKNAIEILDEKAGEKKISIDINKERGFTTISVSDSGPGIPAEILENIFVPFYTTKEKGSGIGLSLSQQLIRQLGGSLSCRTVKEGTTFKIEL